jgi:hypothetical protein
MKNFYDDEISKTSGKIVNEDFNGFTEYQGPIRWMKTPEEGQKGEPYNFFICNRCKRFRFWSRIYGEFPIIDLFTGIDPYWEATEISKIHKNHCHVDGELNPTYKKKEG